MIFEPNAEHVPNFPFKPIGHRPKFRKGCEGTVFFIELNLDPQPVIMRHRIKVINNFKAGLPFQFKAVHAGQIDKNIKTEFRIIANKSGKIKKRFPKGSSIPIWYDTMVSFDPDRSHARGVRGKKPLSLDALKVKARSMLEIPVILAVLSLIGIIVLKVREKMEY